MAIMKYSKGGETTNVHVLYWNDCLFWGMYRVRGLALMAKSMQALCRQRREYRELKSIADYTWNVLTTPFQGAQIGEGSIGS